MSFIFTWHIVLLAMQKHKHLVQLCVGGLVNLPSFAQQPTAAHQSTNTNAWNTNALSPFTIRTRSHPVSEMWESPTTDTRRPEWFALRCVASVRPPHTSADEPQPTAVAESDWSRTNVSGWLQTSRVMALSANRPELLLAWPALGRHCDNVVLNLWANVVPVRCDPFRRRWRRSVGSYGGVSLWEFFEPSYDDANFSIMVRPVSSGMVQWNWITSSIEWAYRFYMSFKSCRDLFAIPGYYESVNHLWTLRTKSHYCDSESEIDTSNKKRIM